MMKHEFEQIAGYRVSDEDYNNIIEPMYLATDLDKISFAATISRDRFEIKEEKTEQRIRFEKELADEIEQLKEANGGYKEQIKTLDNLIAIEDDEYWTKRWKHDREMLKNHIKENNIRIRNIKWVLA